MGLIQERAETLDELGRDLVAAALGSKDLLQPPLEGGMAAARVAAAEVVLDLDAQGRHELTVEVELELPQHVFAVSR